ATVSGKVVDENDQPLAGVSILLLGRTSGNMSSDSGTFRITVPANKAFALTFSHLGYRSTQRNFILNENEKEILTVKLEKGSNELNTVVVTDQRQRREAGLVILNPKNAINIPSPAGGIESLIKVVVGSNNELTSQYTVRGRNYDENLIYVNDFEVFRPYLVRSGQQEGLSFINPELTRNVNFYNGGFQARYGDKMSSVLDIQYRKPRSFGGSAYMSLLEQGLHFEGISKNGQFTFLTGIRNRSNRNLLSSQETKGNYVPSSADWQTVITWQLNNRNQLEFLGNISQTKFNLNPQFSQLSSSVFSPYFSANLGLDIYFGGAEEDRYRTYMAGLALTQTPRKNLRLKWLLSRFQDNEKESIDIVGAYLFGEREFDKSSPDYGLINNPLGAGLYQTFARNRLNISVWNLSHKGSLERGLQYWQWGLSADRQLITDRLNEWEYQDSAGYNVPFNPDRLELNKVLKSAASLQVNRLSGYLQNNFRFSDSSDLTFQAGLRMNYNTLNQEFFITPRLGWAWKPRN
ncbi:MAG: carboxypeptidase-like regulatory domain-containing protein, partial [Chitinophagaceae bacterium]